LALSLPLLAQAPAIPGGQAIPAIRIDGNGDDWPPAKRVLDAKSGAEVAFRNDARNLYVLFAVKGPRAVESLESTGLTILAGNGGVLFLKRAVATEAYIRWRESQGELMTDAERAGLGGSAKHDLCLTFAVGAKGSVSGPLRRLAESEPPEFGVSEGAGGTVYELKIPLAPPETVPGGLGVSPGTTFRISFEWGGTARKILSTPASRQTPPAEAGGLYGVATPAQQFLNMFDSMSRPTTGTKRYAFAFDLTLVKAP
jgi:hypothetical protein